MNYPKRSCTHRMKGHDYRATWKYHLTLLKNPDTHYKPTATSSSSATPSKNK